MHRIAFIELIVFWILWVSVFVGVKRTAHKADVTARSANWGIVLQFVAYCLVWPQWRWARGSVLEPVAMVLEPVAVLLVWSAVKHLGKQWRVQAGLYADHELVRSGPYRFLRHPLYASMLAMYLACAITLSNLWLGLIGLVLFIAGLEIRVRVEDRLLASRFGAEFEKYRKSVRAYAPFLR